jgi:DNA polymerase bacteriophage-type
MLWLDLETRSQCCLKSHGLYQYARHETTQVICMSYAFDDNPVTTWFSEGAPFPASVLEYIKNGGAITAHNAAFERQIFENVLKIDVGLTQWRCSSARALARSLPASLGNLCIALDLPIQKQKEGARLIREYSAPGFLTQWKPGDKETMRDYCEMDVATMRMAMSVVPDITPDQWRQYHITEDINDHGVPVDIQFATAALERSEEIRADVNAQLCELTDGCVQKHTARKDRDAWFRREFEEDHIKPLIKNEKIAFDKEKRTALLSNPETPDRLRRFAELIEDAGGSTVAKYKSMSDTHVSNRVRGSLIWSGAGSTGRFSSRGLQLQNFKRNVFENPQEQIDLVLAGAPLNKPSDTLARLVRSAIHSPHGLTWSDYSQIEARVLPWLSADPAGESILDIFREGRDIYTENANRMFTGSTAPNDPRQAAKCAVLSLGFGGGQRALRNMAKNYGLVLSEDEAENIKEAWRNANPWAKPFWYGLARAAQNAVLNPGQVFTQGRLSFLYNYPDWLWMQLPSGRVIAYPQPRWEMDQAPWEDEPSEKLTVLWGSGKRKAGQPWPRRALSHIILSENATQGAAADLMREAIVRAYDADLPVLFSVHDELVVEGHCADKLTEVMTTAPAWADGLPIDADTVEGFRYGK